MLEELEELKSFLARRGEVELLQVLRHIEEEFERSIDPDYNPDTDSESYSDSEDTEGDLVEELVEINPSMNGFCSLS
tara:strand:+ start:739 stop:969 length:231 start_codon:yes stop_codon:yes gene_type:complete